jgi:hypothetical protein
MAERKAPIDWESVERDYRCGIKTLRQIGIEHGVSHVAVKKRADKEEWTRDLAAKIKAKAESLVTKQAVTRSVTSESRVTENELVEANAKVQADVILSHRIGIPRARAIVMSQLGELEELTNNRDLFQQLGELLYKPDDKGFDRLNEIYQKAISFPTRAGAAKTLSEALRILVGIERQAFSIRDEESPSGAHEATLDDLA